MPEPVPASAPSRPNLARRVGWVLVGTVGAGMLAALLYIASPTLMPITLALLSSAAMGLVAGFLSRWLLRTHTLGLRLAAAAAALTVGMVFLGWLTSGMAGLLPASGGSDLRGVALIALGFATSALALSAWAKPANALEPRPAPNAPTTRMQRRTREPAVWLRLPASFSRLARAERARRRQRAAITLIGEFEHRCPYCLETVERRDPRGVTVCPECKTRHHADCWAVTGTCQVPHQHR